MAGTVSDSDAVEDRFGFIAVVPEALFNRTSLDRLSSTGLLGGVLVLEEESVRVSVTAAATVGGGLYSPDVSTPQVCVLGYWWRDCLFIVGGLRSICSSNSMIGCCTRGWLKVVPLCWPSFS